MRLVSLPTQNRGDVLVNPECVATIDTIPHKDGAYCVTLTTRTFEELRDGVASVSEILWVTIPPSEIAACLTEVPA